jgi:proteasome lid subunit RPN8/RPN11
MATPIDPPPALRIPAAMRRRIEQHLRAELPNEACGLLATVTHASGVREVAAFFPGRNIDASPSRFTMDPADVVAALNEMERHGWDLGAIVHSHPVTAATPSVTDRRESFYPESLTVIGSFASGVALFRAWWMAADPAAEVPIEWTG